MLEIITKNIFQTYYMVILLAIVTSYISINLIEKLAKIERLYLLSCYVFSMFGMIIGAKVLSIEETMIFNKNEFITIFSGFSYMGGVLGYIISIRLYNKIYKGVPKEIINNLLILAIPMIYGISKIACFYSGCCKGITMIPIQIIEMFLYIGIFIFSTVAYNRTNSKKNIANMSLIVMCIVRFFIDFLRVNRNTVFRIITLSQIACVIVVFIGLYRARKVKN